MTSERGRLWRSRWAAVGAAIAVTFGAGGLTMVRADSQQSVFVAIGTQRVLDTRIGVGLSGQLVSQQPRRLDVTGTIPVVLPGDVPGSALVTPDGTTAVVLNVTAVNPTDIGFVSVRPGTATGSPTTSNINITSPGGVYPNAVTVKVPTTGDRTGQIELYYFGVSSTSRTDLLVDVVGYYVQGSGSGTQGPAGPQGPKGDTGAKGAAGPRGYSAWDTIPSGVTITGEFGWDSHIPAGGATDSDEIYVPFGGKAPAAPTVRFQGGSGYTGANTVCSGTWNAPTAPAGTVCIYPFDAAGIDVGATFAGASLTTSGFYISVIPSAAADPGDDMYVYGTWAYRAP